MGRLDDEGYLTIVDRKKDLIIRGGFNVFPRDVEEALREHPAVATACVLGRPDHVHGEEVVAFVTVRGDVGGEELVAFGRERLGGYKYPREIHVLDELPLTPVGKADRKALRERLAAQEGRRGDDDADAGGAARSSGERDLGTSDWHEITQEQIEPLRRGDGRPPVDPRRPGGGRSEARSGRPSRTAT